MPTVNVWDAAFARHFADDYDENLDAVWRRWDYVHDRVPTAADWDLLRTEARRITALEARRVADIALLALTETETAS